MSENFLSCSKNVRTLSRLKREVVISLETSWWKRASSGLEGRISWFFSSCTSKLGVPPELQRGPQGHGRGASGSSSLHERCEGPLGISLQLLPKTRSSSRFEARTSVFYPRADMDLRVPLGFPQGSQASSRVEKCTSAFLPSCNSNVRLPVELT